MHRPWVSQDVPGQFLRRTFELPSPPGIPAAQCVLAVRVRPVDVPGRPTGGQGGDHGIARNAATSQYVAGWDWVQATPDRNTGIWDAVSLEWTQGLLLMYPQVLWTLFGRLVLGQGLMTGVCLGMQQRFDTVWCYRGRG